MSEAIAVLQSNVRLLRQDLTHFSPYELMTEPKEDVLIRPSQLTIVIPAFNEEQAIGAVLDSLLNRFPEINIIVVNDGSTDLTSQVLSAFKTRVTVVEHSSNRGYGAALKTGIHQCTTDAVLWFDADSQHSIDDVTVIANPVLSDKFDAVFGTRQRGSAFVIKRVPGKLILKLVAQIVARRRIPDLNCGFRCFKTKIIKRYLHLLPNGFSASSTSTLLFIKRGYRYTFAPIKTAKRVGSSTVKMFRDGFFTLSLIWKVFILFDAFLLFGFLGICQLLVGGAWSIYIASTLHSGFPILGAIVILAGVMSLFFGVVSQQISEMRMEKFEQESF